MSTMLVVVTYSNDSNTFSSHETKPFVGTSIVTITDETDPKEAIRKTKDKVKGNSGMISIIDAKFMAFEP